MGFLGSGGHYPKVKIKIITTSREWELPVNPAKRLFEATRSAGLTYINTRPFAKKVL